MPADIILNETHTEIVGEVRLTRDSAREPALLLEPANGTITLGGDGRDGDLILKHRAGAETILLDGENANVNLGGNGRDGDLVLKDSAGNLTIHMNGSGGNLHMGGNGQDGDILLRTESGNVSMHLNGSGGNLHLGTRNREGDLFVYDNNGDRALHLDGGNAKASIGRRGNGGRLDIVGAGGDNVIVGDEDGVLACLQLEADRVEIRGVGEVSAILADLEARISDARLKKNVRPLEDGGTVVKNLTPVRFKWKQNRGKRPLGEQVGLVAQQVREVLPEAVVEDSKGNLRIDVLSLVAVLVETVKDQARKIEDQESHLSILSDRVGRLETGQ